MAHKRCIIFFNGIEGIYSETKGPRRRIKIQNAVISRRHNQGTRGAKKNHGTRVTRTGRTNQITGHARDTWGDWFGRRAQRPPECPFWFSHIGLHITFYKTSTDGAEDDALSTWTAITCLYFLHIEAGRVFGLQGRVREDPTMSSNSKPITSDQNFVTTHQTQPAMQCTPPPLYVVLQQQSIYSEQAFFGIFKGHIIIDDGILLLQHIIDDG